MMIFEGRKIAVTHVGNRKISTVELPREPGDPVLFETCIFYDSEPSQVVAQYVEEAEARTRHAWLVEHEQKHLVAKSQHKQTLTSQFLQFGCIIET